MRVILHLDMDAFYAAIEQRERPELRGQPVLVGYPGPRGVVATCSYEARKFGIRSAMPSVRALRLCPDGVWVKPRFELYSAVSQKIFALVREEVPVVEQVSIDEAYGDLTGVVASIAEGAVLARQLKDAIRAQERLTASVGIAPNRFVAKVASDLRKPDGLVAVEPAQVHSTLAPLSVRVIPGVGPRLEERLLPLGIKTIADLSRTPEARLAQLLGAGMTEWLLGRARGEDDTPIEPHHDRKQISEERTYERDLTDRTAIERELLDRAEGVAAELRRRGLVARCITLKARDGAYQTVTRSHTVDQPTDNANEIFEVARALWRDRVDFGGRGVRLIGVGAKELEPEGHGQLELFPDERRTKRRAADRAADLVRDKFGDDAVRPARLVRPPKAVDLTRPKSAGDAGTAEDKDDPDRG